MSTKFSETMPMSKQRARDAEAELNLPPGFRFHPTDEELVIHYLYQKISCHRLPVPIIADIDLYKYDPWELPEKALFGQKEWYFFTPRDRKYPNGSRPNRAAGQGYWKATGADKPVTPKGCNNPLGIKKALVFYAGKAPRGVKTDWIMHEYRLAGVNRRANKGSSRLDDWVLCRLYNKKNTWQKMLHVDAFCGEAVNSVEQTGSISHGTPESITEHDFPDFDELSKLGADPSHACGGIQSVRSSKIVGQQKVEQTQKEDTDWFAGLNLEDFQNTYMSFTATHTIDAGNQDYSFHNLASPMLRSNQGMPPFCSKRI